MSPHRPSVIKDGDAIEFGITTETEFRIPYTFVEALNEGTLCDRQPGSFERAANEQRLFQVVNAANQNMIATAMIQDYARGADGAQHEGQFGGIIVHPAARGFGIASLLSKIVMVHEFGANRYDAGEEEYVAHVMDGNKAPIHALVHAGFRPEGYLHVHLDDFSGAMGHMVEEGQNEIVMHRYVFDPAALDSLIFDLWKFQTEDGGVIQNHHDGVRVAVDFADVIDPAYVEAHIDYLKERGRLPDR